jgi:hypothetical protein
MDTSVGVGVTTDLHKAELVVVCTRNAREILVVADWVVHTKRVPKRNINLGAKVDGVNLDKAHVLFHFFARGRYEVDGRCLLVFVQYAWNRLHEGYASDGYIQKTNGTQPPE